MTRSSRGRSHSLHILRLIISRSCMATSSPRLRMSAPALANSLRLDHAPVGDLVQQHDRLFIWRGGYLRTIAQKIAAATRFQRSSPPHRRAPLAVRWQTFHPSAIPHTGTPHHNQARERFDLIDRLRGFQRVQVFGVMLLAVPDAPSPPLIPGDAPAGEVGGVIVVELDARGPAGMIIFQEPAALCWWPI